MPAPQTLETYYSIVKAYEEKPGDHGFAATKIGIPVDELREAYENGWPTKIWAKPIRILFEPDPPADPPPTLREEFEKEKKSREKAEAEEKKAAKEKEDHETYLTRWRDHASKVIAHEGRALDNLRGLTNPVAAQAADLQNGARQLSAKLGKAIAMFGEDVESLTAQIGVTLLPRGIEPGTVEAEDYMIGRAGSILDLYHRTLGILERSGTFVARNAQLVGTVMDMERRRFSHPGRVADDTKQSGAMLSPEESIEQSKREIIAAAQLIASVESAKAKAANGEVEFETDLYDSGENGEAP